MPPVLQQVSTYDPVVGLPGGKFGPSGGSIAVDDPRNQWPGGAYGTSNNPTEREPCSSGEPCSSLDATLGHRRDPEGGGPSESPPVRYGAPFGYSDTTDLFGYAIENIGKMLMPFPMSIAVEGVQRFGSRGALGFTSGFDVPEAATVLTPFGRKQMEPKHILHNLLSKGQDVSLDNAMVEIANVVAAQHSGIAEPTPERSRTGFANEAAASMMAAASPPAAAKSRPTPSRGRARGPAASIAAAAAAAPASAAANPYGGGDYGGT